MLLQLATSPPPNFTNFTFEIDTSDNFSVRSTYCGIFGFRSSHGPVSTDSVAPMAQLFNTIDSFSLVVLLVVATDLATLSRVTHVFLPSVSADAFDAELQQPSHVIIPGDCFKILGSVEECTYEILNASASKVFRMVNNGNIGDLSPSMFRASASS
ncbi:hypothetical protein ZWY2020_017961 [Hordeum vulgare]|nr:hypothetical protein ZWY2020_017961 [Hordeum vulgare]